jgi:hypothetical protein
MYNTQLPKINAKGVVVWQGRSGAYDQVFRWDPKTKTAVNIFPSSANQEGPQINDKGVVVWNDYIGTTWQIYRWNPKTAAAENISNNSYKNYIPQINAKGQVVWYVDDGVNDYSVWMYNPKTKQAGQISP